jgi:hypothetical protein
MTFIGKIEPEDDTKIEILDKESILVSLYLGTTNPKLFPVVFYFQGERYWMEADLETGVRYRKEIQ